MNAATDWRKHSDLLSAQPSNRRLVQQSRTPRTLRDAGLSGWGDEQAERRIDSIICWGAWAALPFVTYSLFTRVF